jgi:hypothetical protein
MAPVELNSVFLYPSFSGAHRNHLPIHRNANRPDHILNQTLIEPQGLCMNKEPVRL